MKIQKILQKIDNITPTPWIVEGVEQARPLSQIIFSIVAIIILTLVIIFI